MNLSDDMEAAFVDALTGKATFPTITEVKIGLSLADPGEDGAGLDEPSGGSYARVVTTPTDWSSAADDGVGGHEAHTVNDAVFAAATGDWGDLTHYALFDDGDNIIGAGALPATLTVNSGETARVLAGEAKITVT